jgi:outer membrane protein TolC
VLSLRRPEDERSPPLPRRSTFIGIWSASWRTQAREQAVKTAQQFYDDNKQQVQFGSLAEIEVNRAESQLDAATQDLVISYSQDIQAAFR